MAKKKSISKIVTVGRDSKTGQFIAVKEAERRKSTAVVETIKRSSVTNFPRTINATPIHTTSKASATVIRKQLGISTLDLNAGKRVVVFKKKKGANLDVKTGRK